MKRIFNPFVQLAVFVMLISGLAYLGMKILDCTTGSTLAGGC